MSGTPPTLYSQLGCQVLLTFAPVTSTGAGTPIATVGLVSIDGPTFSRGEVETTVLSTTGVKPYKPTLAEGEGTFTLRHMSVDPATQALQAAATAYPCPLYAFTFTFEDGQTCVCNGFTKGYNISGIENETVINAEVPFRIISTPVWTAGTALTY